MPLFPIASEIQRPCMTKRKRDDRNHVARSRKPRRALGPKNDGNQQQQIFPQSSVKEPK